jgi:WD40 repeat protein
MTMISLHRDASLPGLLTMSTHTRLSSAFLLILLAGLACGEGLSRLPAAAGTNDAGAGAVPDAQPPPALGAANRCGQIGAAAPRAFALSRASGHFAVGNADGAITLYTMAGNQVASVSVGTQPILALAFSRDGSRLAASGADARLTLFSVPDAVRVAGIDLPASGSSAMDPPEPLMHLVFSPDGASLLGGGVSGTFVLFRTADLSRVWAHQEGTALFIGFSPDGARVLDGSTYVLAERQASDGASIGRRAIPGRVVGLSPDGTTLIVVAERPGVDEDIRALRLDDLSVLATLRPRKSAVPAAQDMPERASFSPHGDWVVLTNIGDGAAHVWSTRTWTEVASEETASATPWADVAPGELQLLSLASTGAVLIRDLGGQTSRTLINAVPPAHLTGVERVAFSPDGTLLASVGGDLKIWRLRDAVLLASIPEIEAQAQSFAFSPDGASIAYTDATGGVHVASTSDGKEVRHWMTTPASSGVAFMPDGASIITGCRCAGDPWSVVRRWRVADGQEVLWPGGFGSQASGFAFSPDGSRLATAGFSVSGLVQGVSVWNVATGEAAWSVLGSQPSIPGLAWTAWASDGASLAVAFQTAEGEGAKLFRASDGMLLRAVATDTGSITALALSPDGRLVVTGTHTGLRLWRAADGAAAGRTDDNATALAFHPTDKRLAVGTQEGSIRFMCDLP